MFKIIKTTCASICLFSGVCLTAYWVTTPGDQMLAAFFSGPLLVVVPWLLSKRDEKMILVVKKTDDPVMWSLWLKSESSDTEHGFAMVHEEFLDCLENEDYEDVRIRLDQDGKVELTVKLKKEA